MTEDNMLVTTTVGALLPNPFRRIEEYPIQRTKVDALKESIRKTGFWGTIVARPAGRKIEIAFGHHRMIALQEEYGPKQRIDLIVRELTNEEMLQMMARENMEEWGTSAWVEMETVRATVEAYARGEIKLPKIPPKTKTSQLYRAPGFILPDEPTGGDDADTSPHHPWYTRQQVAEFLGWIGHDGRADKKAYTAFRALELIERKQLKERECHGLQRAQLAAMVKGLWRIAEAHQRTAAAARKDAEAERKLAEQVEDKRQQQAALVRAKTYDKQAELTEQQGKDRAREFAAQAGEHVREGKGSKAITSEVERFTPTTPPKPPINVDTLAGKIAKDLHKIAAGEDKLSERFNLLRKTLADASAESVKNVSIELQALEGRLARWRSQLVTKQKR